MSFSNEYSPQKICRVCTNFVEDPIALFESRLSPSGWTIAEFLGKITNLQIVSTDGLPTGLCAECVGKITDCSDFIQLCLNSDSVLKGIIENLHQNKDEEITSEIELNNVEVVQCESKYKCDSCGLDFSNKKGYLVHKRIHNKDKLLSNAAQVQKRFNCSVCSKEYPYEYLLKQHEYKHKDEKPFPCQNCGKGCLTAQSLSRHRKTHDENYKAKKYVCSVCSKEFPYPSHLAEHMKNHTGERPHLCSFCGKGFRQSGALHYHQKVHTGSKPFSCEICNGDFRSRSVLKVHMRKHTNERPYVCHICGMAFRQCTDLKGHQRTHSGDKPVLCPICGKRMSTTGQLTVHLRSHTGEKPFECSVCRKAFSTKTILIKHERIHTGERPYVCDVCGRAFNQLSTLKTHKNTHDGDRKEKKNKSVEKIVNEGCTVETEVITGEFMSDQVPEGGGHFTIDSTLL